LTDRKRKNSGLNKIALCRRAKINYFLIKFKRFKMKELNLVQMEEIEGGTVLGCFAVGATLIGIGFSGPLGWGAAISFGLAGIAGAIDQC